MENNQLQTTNSAQVPQELMRLKSGEEKFEIAIGGNKIISSPLESLKEVLRLVMLKLGIRGNNLPSDEEKAILLAHIVENYGRHTCEEVKLAFDLALEGKLDVEVKAYENFSCLYFSSIMNAYRSWSLEPFSKLQYKKRQLALPYEERQNLTDEDMKEWIKEWDLQKLNSTKINYVPVLFYDWLEKTGQLLLTPEAKGEYINKAALYKKQEYDMVDTDNKFMKRIIQQFYTEFNNKTFSQSNVVEIKGIAKKIAVFDYLKSNQSEQKSLQGV